MIQILAPSVKDIDIEDIAHALSMICRFGGHTRRHYSVAEHSWRVSIALRQEGASRLEQLEGLMHDAAEAYVGDVTWPLKNSVGMEGYYEIEHLFEDAIRCRFGLPLKLSAKVKRMDLVLLETEKRDLTNEGPGRRTGNRDVLEAGTALEALGGEGHGFTIEPLKETIQYGGTTEFWRRAFLEQYRILALPDLGATP